MTWDELEELRDRLADILERERAEDGFCPYEGQEGDCKKVAKKLVENRNMGE